MKTLQKFSSVHAAFHNHFNQERHLVSRTDYKLPRSAAMVAFCLLCGDQRLVAVGLTEPL